MKCTVRSVFLCSIAFSVIVGGCRNAKDKEAVKQSKQISLNEVKAREKIEEITQLLNKAVIANDYGTQLKYFTENAVIVPPLGPAVKGKSEIKEGFDRNMRDNVVVHAFNATIEDLWVCGDRVYERGNWAMAQSSQKSKKPQAFYGSYFQIWRAQEDSSLLIDYNIFTLGFNPFEGHG